MKALGQWCPLKPSKARLHTQLLIQPNQQDRCGKTHLTKGSSQTKIPPLPWPLLGQYMLLFLPLQFIPQISTRPTWWHGSGGSPRPVGRGFAPGQKRRSKDGSHSCTSWAAWGSKNTLMPAHLPCPLLTQSGTWHLYHFGSPMDGEPKGKF